MQLGRVLLISAILHGALLLAPIPDPSAPAPPAAPPAATLVWMEPVAPARSVMSAAIAPVPEAPAPTAAPAAIAPAASTLRARVPASAQRARTAGGAAAGRDLAAGIAELPVEAGDVPGAAPGAAGARAIPGRVSGAALPGLPLAAAPPPAPAPAPALDARAYGEHIRQRIDAEKHYPGRARRLGLEGVAIVIVTVDGHGRLAAAPRLARSSGVAALDAEALRMARAAAPFSPPPAAPLALHVPVRFSLADAP